MRQTVGTQEADAFGELGVGGDDHAALAGDEILVREEGEDAGVGAVADGAGFVEAAADAVGGVLEDMRMARRPSAGPWRRRLT
jgi:hypothetical protein